MIALAVVAALQEASQTRPVDIPVGADLAERAPQRDSLARPLGAAVAVAPARENAPYLRRLVTGFTSVTAENAMKWEALEPREGRFRWPQADAIVDLADGLGKRMRGHTLIWDQQLPGWVREREWDAAGAERLIRDHVRRVAGRYRGRIAQWDVVNEPLDPDGSLTPNLFTAALGERYIDIAFDEARRADPDARLFLNELGSERPSPMQDGLVALVKRLERRGVPIDGIGLQNHANVTNPQSTRQWLATFERFGDLGVDVEITEMDVVIPPKLRTTPARLRTQAKIYADAARACRRTPVCTGLTLWGVTDRFSWLTPQRRPLPYGVDGDAKPAARALMRALEP